jgi:hypothetical protein
MINPLGEIGKLFKPTDESVPTQEEWPEEKSAGYYDDVSLQELAASNAGTTEVLWSPTADQSIPYRGQELHGIAANTKHYEVIPSPIVPEPDQSTPVPVVTVPEVPPVKVEVVQGPTPPYVEKYIATNQFSVVQGSPNVKILQKSDRRFRARVKCANGTVLVSWFDNSSISAVGYLLSANQDLELDVTQPVYAAGTSGTADTVYVMEEVQREYLEDETSAL